MKNISKITVIILIVLSAFGCKKRPFDFRNKYVGDYDITYSYSSWQLNSGVYNSDTLSTGGKVYYDKKDQIIISYNTNSTLILGITKDGNLSLSCGTEIGKFDNKNEFRINYGTNSCPGGGMGGGTNYCIIGTRFKRK